MVDEHPLGKSFQDPRMLESLKWCDTLLRIPVEALDDEVEERVAVATDDLGKRARSWESGSTILILKDL